MPEVAARCGQGMLTVNGPVPVQDSEGRSPIGIRSSPMGVRKNKQMSPAASRVSFTGVKNDSLSNSLQSYSDINEGDLGSNTAAILKANGVAGVV